jgi:hypothetical protein
MDFTQLQCSFRLQQAVPEELWMDKDIAQIDSSLATQMTNQRLAFSSIRETASVNEHRDCTQSSSALNTPLDRDISQICNAGKQFSQEIIKHLSAKSD